MKLLLTCCLLFIVSGCFEVEEKATTASMKAPEEYRWRYIPQTIYYAQDLPTDYQTYTRDMALAWNSISPTQSYISVNSSQPSNYEAVYSNLEAVSTDGKNVIYLVKSDKWPSKSSDALGVAILMGRVNDYGQFILQEADVLIKDTGSTTYDPETIILHELGHFLGLQHQKVDRSLTVMYPSIAQGEIKNFPKTLDKRILERLYKVFSGTTPSTPDETEIPEGQGDLTRMIFELGADMNCRHLMNGVEVHSHKVKVD